MRLATFLFALTLALPLASALAAEGAEGGSGWMAEFDKLWPNRDDKKVLDQLYKIVEPVQKAKDSDFEACWRLSSLLNWDANNYPDGSLKAGLGKRAWSVGDKAIQTKPEDVHGQYNAAVGIGLYSEGVGILNALAQGLEGKFRSRAQAAIRLNKDYLDGAPQVIWGRFFYKLPWPKRDIDESIKILTQVTVEHPTNLRAKWYLADSLFADGKKAEAKKQIEAVLAAPIGTTDPAEDRKIKAEANKFLEAHKGDL